MLISSHLLCRGHLKLAATPKHLILRKNPRLREIRNDLLEALPGEKKQELLGCPRKLVNG